MLSAELRRGSAQECLNLPRSELARPRSDPSIDERIMLVAGEKEVQRRKPDESGDEERDSRPQCLT
jgi:hypothetical protein